MSCHVGEENSSVGTIIVARDHSDFFCLFSDFFLICHDNSFSNLFNLFKVILANKLTSLGVNFKANLE